MRPRPRHRVLDTESLWVVPGEFWENGGMKTTARTDVEPNLAGCRLSLGSGMTVLRRLLCRRSVLLLVLLLGLLLSRHEEEEVEVKRGGVGCGERPRMKGWRQKEDRAEQNTGIACSPLPSLPALSSLPGHILYSLSRLRRRYILISPQMNTDSKISFESATVGAHAVTGTGIESQENESHETAIHMPRDSVSSGNLTLSTHCHTSG